jgi:hypothetical protein
MADTETRVDEDRLVRDLLAGEWADLTLDTGYAPDRKPILSVAFLTKLLLGSDPRAPLLPFGVRIRGARLDGELNLADCFGPYGGSFGVLALEECDLPGRVTVSNTDFSRLSIRKSRFREFWGEGTRIKADFDFRETSPLPAIDASMTGSAFLWLRGTHIGGDIKGSRSILGTPSEIPQGMTTVPAAFTLRLAQIGGDLALSGARLSSPSGLAFDAVHLVVHGRADFSCNTGHRFEADGEVRMSSASIGGACFFDGARLTNPEGDTLDASGCTIGGDLYLTVSGEHRFESEGQLVLQSAKISGDLFCGGARLSKPGGMALNAHSIAIVGQALFSVDDGHRFEADGLVRMSSASIGGHCFFDGARLTNPEGDTLNAYGCTFGGNLYLIVSGEHRFESEGQLALQSAKISGDLFCNGARLSKPGGVALGANGIVIAGQALLGVGGGHRFEADGEVRMSSASIGGACFFDGARFTNPEGTTLFAYGCTFGSNLYLTVSGEHRFESEGQLDLSSAKISGDLFCNGARLSKPGGMALNAGSIVVGGQAQFGVEGGHRFEADGEVHMSSASIGGHCFLDGARLTNPEGDTLYASGCTIGGDLYLTVNGQHRFESEGRLVLESAKISGNLSCGGARLSKPGGLAMNANSIVIGGQALFSVDDGHRFEADGVVRMPSASIGGDCFFRGARLTNPEGTTLFAYGCTIGGNLLLTIDGEHRFESEGQLFLASAKISGNLQCDGARLSNPRGVALKAHSITIAGQAQFGVDDGHRFEADGEVRMPGASIGGACFFDGARFTNPEGDTLSASDCTFGGDLWLTIDGEHRFESEGQLVLASAKISGDLFCNGARLSKPGGMALNAGSIVVGGQAQFGVGGGHRFEADGEVRMPGASIGGDCFFRGARLTNPEGDTLSASDCTFGGGLYLTGSGEPRFESEGQLVLLSAKISGDLGFQGARLSKPGGRALAASAITVTALRAHDNEFIGDIDLSESRIDALGSFAPSAWKGAGRIGLDSISVRQVLVDVEDGVPWKQRRDWIRKNSFRDKNKRLVVSPHPWRECASAFVRSGRNLDARRLLREGYREENRARPKWQQLFVWLFAEIPFGFGMSLVRTTVTVIGFWIVGSVGVEMMSARGVLVEAQTSGAPRLCSSAVAPLYALDVAIPFIDLRQESRCDPLDMGQAGLFPGFATTVPSVPWASTTPAIQSPTVRIFEEITLWNWGKAIYSLLGALVVGFAAVTYSGVFKPKE